MEAIKLNIIKVKESIECDYCHSIAEKNRKIFVKIYEDGTKKYLCSSDCLDSFETEEFLNSDEYRNGFLG